MNELSVLYGTSVELGDEKKTPFSIYTNPALKGVRSLIANIAIDPCSIIKPLFLRIFEHIRDQNTTIWPNLKIFKLYQ